MYLNGSELIQETVNNLKAIDCATGTKYNQTSTFAADVVAPTILSTTQTPASRIATVYI